jgi:endonuclease/exonuclease/phosphatase family metal-dependent hydrolase
MRQRLEAVAQLIEANGVDVALLQEVARTRELRADQWLADRLGMAYVYSRANGHESAIGFEEGLAVYSRFPLAAPTLAELRPGSPVTRRLGLGVLVKTSCGDLQVFSVHLGLLPHHNAAQLAHLRHWIATSQRQYPVMIGGDFNAHENSTQIAQARESWIDTFRHLHPEADGSTHEIRWPWGSKGRRRRLDYLFLRPGNVRWQVQKACHLDTPGEPHSDHRAVLASLALDG